MKNLASNLLTAMMILSFLPFSVGAVESNCPWLVREHFSRVALEKMDPGDQKALQDLLQGIFENPTKRLSAEDKVWVRDFKLESAIETMRAEGKKVQSRIKKQKLTRAAAIGLGSSISLGLLTKKIYDKALEQIDLEDVINKRYGLTLKNNSSDDLRLLERVLECDPTGSARLRNFFGNSTPPKNKGMNLNELLNTPESVREAVVRLTTGVFTTVNEKHSYGGPYFYSEESNFANLKDIWKKTGIVLCTRWSHDSREYFTYHAINQIHSLLTKQLPHHVLKSLRELKGIIRVSAQYQPKGSNPYQSTILGLYIPAVKRIEVYNDEWDYEAEFTVTHEIGHALSHERSIGNSDEWKRINWDFDLKRSWHPKADVWWPSSLVDQPGSSVNVYAKTNPEETWGEAFACYLVSEICKREMAKKNQPMHDFIENIIGSQ